MPLSDNQILSFEEGRFFVLRALRWRARFALPPDQQLWNLADNYLRGWATECLHSR